MSLKRLVILTISSLILAVMEFVFVPRVMPYMRHCALVFSAGILIFYFISLDDALIFCLIGGVFESFFGIKYIGFYSFVYCLTIFLLFLLKKHVTVGPIAHTFLYIFTTFIYMNIFWNISFDNLNLLSASVFANLLFTASLILFVKFLRKT